MDRAGRSKLFVCYVTAQALALASFFFVPLDGWARVIWRVAIGWAGALFVVVGLRVRRPAGASAWYLFALGVFLNTTGILVERIVGNPSQVVNATWADAFWLSLFPALAAGMAHLIRHGSVEKDWAALVDAAIITTGFALLAWVFVIRPTATDASLELITRIVAIAYPLGDLVILGMMLRLLLGVGSQGPAFRLMVGALLAMLSADIGWAVVNQLGVAPSSLLQHLLETCSMTMFVMFGAAALHPSVGAIAEKSVRPRTYLTPMLLAGLTTASLMAPAILFWQVFRHDVTDGAAIAICATILFLLVVIRMVQLLRRIEERTKALAERNKAVRLVLDTVNEGLLRVSRDGTLMPERSAIIDRWFRSFDQPVRFVDYIREFDANFADWFQLAHEALLEDVLPLEVGLAQLPARLSAKKRELKVNYLPVTDGDKQEGLLVVIEDITEQLELAHKDAEQRELLAAFQGFMRDRSGFLSFFDEATGIVNQLTEGMLDPVTRARLVHTLKGNASMASLKVTVGLCQKAEDEMAEKNAPEAATVEALRRRWVALSDAFTMFIGDKERRTVAVEICELEDLAGRIRRGMSTPDLLDRLATWHDEPVERPLERLAEYGRSLARRLGKGNLDVELSAGGLRLDPQRWSPLFSALVHIVRNALDHGFETPNERSAAGKAPHLRLRLSAFAQNGEMVLEIEDDGRGIDWEAIRRAAKKRGSPANTGHDLWAALKSPGVSTSDTANEISGRGIGMSAVADCVAGLGGTLDVTSQLGRGTCFRLSFPRASLAQETDLELPNRRGSALRAASSSEP